MAAAADLFAAGPAAPAATAAPRGFKARLEPDEALRALRDGNECSAAGASSGPGTGIAPGAREAASGQGPFASIVGYADSGAWLDLAFSNGVGGLFVVGTAGNVAYAVRREASNAPSRPRPPCPLSWATRTAARSLRRSPLWRRTPPSPAPSTRSPADRAGGTGGNPTRPARPSARTPSWWPAA